MKFVIVFAAVLACASAWIPHEGQWKGEGLHQSQWKGEGLPHSQWQGEGWLKSQWQGEGLHKSQWQGPHGPLGLGIYAPAFHGPVAHIELTHDGKYLKDTPEVAHAKAQHLAALAAASHGHHHEGLYDY